MWFNNKNLVKIQINGDKKKNQINGLKRVWLAGQISIKLNPTKTFEI